MSHQEMACRRPSCDGVLTVDADQDSARCPRCGQKHTPPWEESGGRRAAHGSNEGAAVSVERDGQHIHIHLHLD